MPTGWRVNDEDIVYLPIDYAFGSAIIDGWRQARLAMIFSTKDRESAWYSIDVS